MPKISVIITTKNEDSVLEDLFASLDKQSYRNFEVILVDNYSNDKTVDIAKKRGAIVYTKGPERSAQRNFGVSKAGGDYVLILDADMSLTKNVLKDLSKVKEQIAIVPEQSFGKGFWTRFKVFEREFYVGDDSIEAPRYFSKKLFLKYWGYDTKITGPEDYDLPLRMKKDGHKVVRIKSYILHNERYFSPIKSAKKKFYYASHSLTYVSRHKEMILQQGNVVFRPVFFKKINKIIEHPFLGIGMLFVKLVEGFGILGGFIYAKFKK